MTATHTNVFGDAMLAAFDASTKPVDEAEILPPVLYTSPEFFEFEKQAIFLHDWLCVGRSAQVPNPGDYFAITLFDEPLVVTRDKDGAVRVLSAVCQHRGMVVVEGSGNCSKFTCPYHHWSYGTDGRLLGAPAMERAIGFDKTEFSLASLRTEEWNGFVFASFDRDVAPLAPSLRKLTDLLANFRLDESVTIIGETFADLPWNWKVMHENFNDAYHASRLHHGIGDFVPGENAVFLPWDDSDNHVTRLNGHTVVDASFNPMAAAILPVFSGLSIEERWRSMFALVPPTLGMAIVPNGVTYFVVNPKSASAIDIHIGYCFEPAALDDPLFDLKFEQEKSGVNNFNVQDIWADTMVQRGLRSVFSPHGRYSWEEETLRQFNRWLVQRYRAHWPTPTPS
jgi:phenylpropionate dioxygenase-like ring-hydroxylating dioxygenase large terminal subunit